MAFHEIFPECNRKSDTDRRSRIVQHSPIQSASVSAPPPFASILSMVTYITASNNYILSDMIFLSASYNMQCR